MSVWGWFGIALVVNALVAWTEVAFECRQLCRAGNSDFILNDPNPNWDVAVLSLRFGLLLLMVQAVAWLLGY